MRAWKVKSKSNPKIIYTVTKVAEQHWECTCPQFVHRHATCKHIKLLWSKYARRSKARVNEPSVRNNSGASKLPSDNRGSQRKENNLPSGQLRRSGGNNAGATTTSRTTKPARSQGYSGSGENIQNGLGESNTQSNMSRSIERSNQTTTQENKKLFEQRERREKIREEFKRQKNWMDQWILRETKQSAPYQKRLRDLDKKLSTAKEEDKRFLNAQMIPLRLAIEKANKRTYEKPPFKTDLLDTGIDKLTDSELDDYLELL